jgi:hypothetical protein
MSSRVFTHLFRVSLASRIFYSSQRLHMEVNTSCNYQNINIDNHEEQVLTHNKPFSL